MPCKSEGYNLLYLLELRIRTNQKAYGKNNCNNRSHNKKLMYGAVVSKYFIFDLGQPMETVFMKYCDVSGCEGPVPVHEP